MGLWLARVIFLHSHLQTVTLILQAMQNRRKQQRGLRIIDHVLTGGIAKRARLRQTEETASLKSLWSTLVDEVNAEFNDLPPLNVEQAKNAFRHYKRVMTG